MPATAARNTMILALQRQEVALITAIRQVDNQMAFVLFFR
jgi:hypothetical protein